MPKYTFECECGKSVTLNLSIHGEIPQDWPCTCGKTMPRVWDVPGVTFNGQGFYSTDNRK